MKRSTDAAMRAIENAEKNPCNPFVLNGLFAAAHDVHNSHGKETINKWVATLAHVARHCADSRPTREGAFEILKAVFNKAGQSSNVRFYALGAMQLLRTEKALPIMLEAAKDPLLLKEIPHMHEWIDDILDKLLTRGRDGDDEKVLDALGAALGSPSEEVRRYFSDKLLVMDTRESHKVLVEKSLEHSNEFLVYFLADAYDLKYNDDAQTRLPPEFFEALVRLLDRVRRDREFHIAPEALRPLVEKAVRKQFPQLGDEEMRSKAAFVMERLCPQKAPPEPPRPIPRRQARIPAGQMGRRARLTLVTGGKNPELPR